MIWLGLIFFTVFFFFFFRKFADENFVVCVLVVKRLQYFISASDILSISTDSFSTQTETPAIRADISLPHVPLVSEHHSLFLQ